MTITAEFDAESTGSGACGRMKPDLPTIRCVVTFQSRAAGGTTMALFATFSSPDAMDELQGFGFEKGMSTAVGQMDGARRDP